MNDKGQVFDNFFVEGLWQTTKYEQVYLKEYRDVRDSLKGIGAYIEFCNNEWLHQSLDYRTLVEVYFEN